MKFCQMRILYFIMLFCLSGAAFFLPVVAMAQPERLSEARIRAVLTEELNYYDQVLRARDTVSLIGRVTEMTHADSIFFAELNLKMAGMSQAAAPQRHHFNREPFLVMLENAKYLNPSDFELTFRLGDINVQYDGQEAIVLLSGTAKGSVTEPVSGLRFLFNITHTSRNNVRANPLTYISYDSIACRMNVDYMPYTTNPQVRDAFLGYNNDPVAPKPEVQETWAPPPKAVAPAQIAGQ